MVRTVVLRVALLATGIVLLSGCGGGERSLLLLDELPTVGSIEFEGNRAFDDGTLRGVMTLKPRSLLRPFGSTRFSVRQLESDILAITTFYVRHGYLRARVTYPTYREADGKMHITLRVDEGEPVMVRGVRIFPPDPSDAEGLARYGLAETKLEAKLRDSLGRPLDLYALEEDRRILTRALAERGYIHAGVKTNVQFEGDEAVIFHRLFPDTVYTVGAIVFAGQEHLPADVLLRDVELDPGDRFRLSRVETSQQQLLASGYFNDVRWDTVGADPATGRTDLRFTVRERKLRWVEAGLGVSSTNRLRVTGTWGTRNFLGRGSRLAFVNRADIDLGRSVGSYLDEARSELLYLRRHLLGTRWEGQPGVYFNHDREPDYSQNIVGLTGSVRRLLGDLRNQIVLSVENRWVVNDADSTARARDVQLERERYVTRLASGTVQLDSRNDFFDPTGGAAGELRLEVAGGALGGNTGFVKGTANVRRFLRAPVGNVTLAWRLQAGIIRPTRGAPGARVSEAVLDAERIPAEDRYRLGGANSVRGYDEDALDGALTDEGIVGGVVGLLGNVELRAPLISRLSAVAFFDAGNVWQDPSQITWRRFEPSSDRTAVDPRDMRYSFGGGLRFATPVGPIRLDYARKWNIPIPTAGATEKDKWHVSLGHSF